MAQSRENVKNWITKRESERKKNHDNNKSAGKKVFYSTVACDLTISCVRIFQEYWLQPKTNEVIPHFIIIETNFYDDIY